MRRFREGIWSDGEVVEGLTQKFSVRRGGEVAWDFRATMRWWRSRGMGAMGDSDLGRGNSGRSGAGDEGRS